MVALDYTDTKWKDMRFKKMWNKSDIYHIFSHREHLSERFRRFREQEVLPKYRASARLEADSDSNYQNIEALLDAYLEDPFEAFIHSPSDKKRFGVHC